MNRLLLLTLVLTMGMIFPDFSASQCKQGDLVLTANGTSGYMGLFHTTWTGSLKTLHGGVTLSGVKMAYGNLNACAIGTTTGNIYQFDSKGAVSTVTTLTPTGGMDITLDQDASFLVVNFNDYKIYRVLLSGVSVLYTFPSTYGKPRTICRDGNTGDFIVGTVSGIGSGRLVRFSSRRKSIASLSSAIGSVYGVDWIPQTGEYVVACLRGTRQYLSWVTATGSTRSSYPLTNVNCVTVNQKTGQVFAATTKGMVYEFTYSGSYVRRVSYGSNYLFSGIDVWEDQNVSTLVSVTQKQVQVALKFVQSPGRPFIVAISFASYPGLMLTANHWLNLNLDPLFFLTVGGGLPYFTSNFSGTLDGTGRAFAYFMMPVFGTPVYVCAAVVNPAFPIGLDISNVEVVDVL